MHRRRKIFHNFPSRIADPNLFIFATRDPKMAEEKQISEWRENFPIDFDFGVNDKSAEKRKHDEGEGNTIRSAA